MTPFPGPAEPGPHHGSWSTPGSWPAPPPGYAQGAYPYPPPHGYGYGPPVQSSNGLAIASMVLGIVWVYWLGSILAIVLGHVALSQIKRNPYQSGRGMAIAGCVLGYLGLALLLLLIVGIATASSGPDVVTDYGTATTSA